MLLLACFALGGCGSTVHAYNVRAVGEEHTQWNSFFLAGSVGEARVDVERACGPGGTAAEMGVHHNALTVALTIVTVGIYTPRVSTLTCGAAGAQASVQQ
ncbi:hypothetical protein BH11MYX4_BH11MYX4_48080 [soil metagenome]